MMARKTIVVPCIVNSWLNVSADTSVPFGRISCARMTAASRPPTMKKKSAETRYSAPIRLWSMVVSQLQTPLSRRLGWTSVYGGAAAIVAIGFVSRSS